MDTERMYLADNNFALTVRELTPEDLESAKHFVEMTRHLQEIHSLFLVFKYNIDILQDKYELMNGGKVFCDQKPANNEADYIAINAYLTNIISAGKTLVNSMQCYVESNSYVDSAVREKYLGFVDKIYNTSFAYKLLIRLRDYAQHGHLPVSAEGNSYYFDLVQIVNKPHYNHNRTLEAEMNRIIDEIITVYADTPTIALTESLAEFVVNLIAIYKQLLHWVQDELTEDYNKFQNIISAYPENILNMSGLTFFVYDIVDDNAHIVNTADAPLEMLHRFQKEAELVYNDYATAYKTVLSGNLYVQCTDEKLLIGPGEIFADNMVQTDQD